MPRHNSRMSQVNKRVNSEYTSQVIWGISGGIITNKTNELVFLLDTHSKRYLIVHSFSETENNSEWKLLDLHSVWT